MNKRTAKKIPIVALSAILLGTGTGILSACGGKNDYELTVSIFGNAQDGVLNRTLCEQWAKAYNKKMHDEGKIPADKTITVNFLIEENRDSYFQTLTNDVMSNNAPDIFYVQPKNVKAWAQGKQVLDLTNYFDDSAETRERISDVWEDGLGFYGYSTESGYIQGEAISWDGEKFTTQSGKKAGLYGLPKDYSSFGLGYNGVFFTEELKEAYTTTKATAARSVTGGSDNTKSITFKGEDDGVITYAVSGSGYTAGENANIINLGVPTRYKPYNFYRFPNFNAAVEGGDIVATNVVQLTEDVTGDGKGDGYVVTIPGWPGEQFDLPAGTQVDEDAPYDSSKGHITYTYAEYSALTWALTYYLNTFAWNDGESDPLNGTGGRKLQTGAMQNVYGNDQYDGTLYLLPWLAGNDASYLNSSSTKVINGTDGRKVGTEAENIKSLSLSGEYEDRAVQYGVNSENYIETYGAFLAYGSDWNGNSNQVGDTTATKPSGWEYFCSGAQLFYGAGTWDASSLNRTDYDYLQFHLMPEPIGEKYALYSTVKSADYDGENKKYGTSKVYSRAEILQNQVTRQDKWGARMDSVGYSVNGALASATGDAAWKAEGAASLVQALTIDPEVQKTLTYAGSQLPNFKSQCKEFLNYQSVENGSFADMVTPDGDKNGNREVWTERYAIARRMVADNTGTVKAWMAQNAPEVPFDEKNYGDDPMTKVDNLAYAMKILYLVPYTEADRDLYLRMQSGLNSVRDSGAYTYNIDWLLALEGRGTGYLVAYESKAGTAANVIIDKLKPASIIKSTAQNAFDTAPQNKFATPQWFCLYKAPTAQSELDKAIKQEQNLLK